MSLIVLPLNPLRTDVLPKSPIGNKLRRQKRVCRRDDAPLEQVPSRVSRRWDVGVDRGPGAGKYGRQAAENDVRMWRGYRKFIPLRGRDVYVCERMARGSKASLVIGAR